MINEKPKEKALPDHVLRELRSTSRYLEPGVRTGLPTGWEDAERAGIELAMVALKRDEFVLALFRGAPKPGTVSEICFGLAADEIDTVRASL